MELVLDVRTSDSPWIDRVWTCTSEGVSQMTSVAGVSWGLVFWVQDGQSHVSLSGPATRADAAPVPEGATFVGIEFEVGTALRGTSMGSLVDGGIGRLPQSGREFLLSGQGWEVPGPDDAEALVARLVRSGALVADPLVAELRQGGRPPLSSRTLERRFRQATGLTQGAVRQIERARAASVLLSAGTATADVVTTLGYYDEPHLARALRRLIGRTARQLREGSGGALGLAQPNPTTS